MSIRYQILFLRDPGAVAEICDWVPGVKVAAGASAASLTFTLGKSQISVKRTGRATWVSLKSMYNPHTLIGG